MSSLWCGGSYLKIVSRFVLILRSASPVHGDRVQLQQVMLNLIVNAIEAMASVESEVRDLMVRTEPSGEETFSSQSVTQVPASFLRTVNAFSNPSTPPRRVAWGSVFRFAAL